MSSVLAHDLNLLELRRWWCIGRFSRAHLILGMQIKNVPIKAHEAGLLELFKREIFRSNPILHSVDRGARGTVYFMEQKRMQFDVECIINGNSMVRSAPKHYDVIEAQILYVHSCPVNLLAMH